MKAFQYLLLTSFYILLFTNFLTAQCGCDVFLHNREVGDGLQALDFQNMPDSASSLFIQNDTTGWIELAVPYSSVIENGTVKPGVNICLGNIVRRLFIENITGDSLHPVVIKNRPGIISEISNEPTYAGLQIHNSKFFEVRGDCGLPDSVHGIYIHGINSNGIEVSGQSERFTIHKVKVDTAGTGIKIKDNRDAFFAGCQPSGVAAPQDSSWFASNISISNCLLVNLSNEGIYLNNTSYKFEYQCDTNLKYYGYEMDGIDIQANKIVNAGKDGIQTTGVVRNCVIQGNEILNVGTGGSAAQGNGIHFGEGCSGKIADNWIEKTSGVGIFSAGIGTIDIYQNVVLQSGTDAIRASAGTTKCEGSCKYSRSADFFGLTNFYDLDLLRIFNNTIAFAGEVGININAPKDGVQMKKLYINNNIITEWGVSALDFISSPTANYDGFTHAGNNFITEDIADMHFANGVMNAAWQYGINGSTDLHLTANSGACDSGVELSWMDSIFVEDFEDSLRIQQMRLDCGAFESNHAHVDNQDYVSTSECTCVLPKQMYGFDGEGLGDGYKICLVDTLRSQRIWFQNLEGSATNPVSIQALKELTLQVTSSSNAIAFKDCSDFQLSGEVIHISATNANYANVDFTSGNTGHVVLANLDIHGSDDLIDVSHGYGTNLLESLTLENISLQSSVAGKNLIRIKGSPNKVILKNIKATSGQLNQTLMEINLKAGGDFGIYNSIFDGFDTDLTMHKWIQLTMQSDGSSYLANKVEFVNNTMINLANSNSNSTANFRLLHKAGTGYVDSLIFVNNAIHKSAIDSILTSANYQNSNNQLSNFASNAEIISNNFSTRIADSLYLDSAYIPTSLSPLLDQGLDLPNSLVRWSDFYSQARPDSVNQLVDIGACEFGLGLSEAGARQTSDFIDPIQELKVQVYPNPVSDVLKVSALTAGAQITIVNGQGQKVFQHTADSTDLLEISTDVWPEGMYHFRVVADGAVKQAHIIVNH